MCGIAGVWNKGWASSDEIVRNMISSLDHRGPDGTGYWTELPIALGHSRLAIIDLVSGDQPMTTADNRYVIVFNGEIYNYLELREELEKQGIVFRTKSDTEVLIEGYALWGNGMLDRLAGMFAFAIWDRRNQSLFIARDRVGKKPLLYYWDGETFAFASELKALLNVPGCEPKLDTDAVDLYFALGYIPAPYAVFQNIKKLQPGHFLQFNNGKFVIKRYWCPEKTTHSAVESANDHIDEFRSLIQESIRIRLRSDVPIAIFLSGGIDSSIVATQVVEQSCNLQALSVVFDEDRTDLPYAKQVAEFLGLPHEIVKVTGDVAGNLKEIFWQYDEPFADTSNIPSFFISQAAAERNFKVVLNGDGGDEVFGGYQRYEYVVVKQHLKSMACVLKFKDGRFYNPWQVYFQSKAIFREAERKTLLKGILQKSVFAEFIDNEPFLSACKPQNRLQMAMLADRHVYLTNDLLYKMDIALSAFGVEGRSPFLDHRVLEWAQGLPAHELVSGREKKILLKKFLKGSLPDEVIHRPKYGFGSPVKNWLMDEMADLLHEYLPSPLFDLNIQNRLLERFSRYHKNDQYAYTVWTLFVFAVWAEQYKARW